MRSRTILIPSAAILGAFFLCLATLGRAQTPANDQANLARAIAWEPNAKAQVPPPAAQWIAPDWQGPGQVLADVSFDDIPIGVVATKLRQWFQDSVDVIVPSNWTSPPMGQRGQAFTFSSETFAVNLHVKNVNAEELFNAMNLALEAENSPVRWQLQMNGDRPLAILRVLPAMLPQLAAALYEPSPAAAAAPPPEKKRMVFFVGDLASGGMEKLYRTVRDVYDKGYASDGAPAAQNDIKFHEEAQLLIVNATPDRVDFVQNILVALREKREQAQREAARRQAAAVDSSVKKEPPPKPEAAPEPKP